MKQLLLFSLICLLTATGISAKPKHPHTGKDIPYEVADHYFVRNDAFPETFKALKLETKEAFDAIFAPAALNGIMPTKIDFSKQYVIAVVAMVTDQRTDMKPLSLKRTGKNLVLRYSYTLGEKQSYSSRYCIILVVDAKYKGAVKAVKV